MKHDVQTKAYVAEPPNSAPRYHTARSSLPDVSKRAVRLLSDAEPADFFPWSGHHAEDILNELTTRNGFYDKLAASQNESLTAKPSILSSLKNKSGLHLLSSHFSSALSQRERHGTITAASTFKPPPRVTLTDTKKEAWLRDLADSEIPLRRLSRTIPHGIRGRILLDHCLSKGIPISRAIWLVKCVGANEIRACKRKGTSGNFTVGGEAKWIKDWTTNVEQFLESIIDTCGSENWKAHMSYGLRLVSFIHAEHLLDRDEYYKWMIGHLATNDLDDLPLWLLIMKTHREDILRCREHGILLASALLLQLNHARKPVNKSPYDPLFQELLKECRALLTESPDCFLFPQCWDVNKQVIQDLVISGDKLLHSLFDDLTLRNGKFGNDICDLYGTVPRTAPQNIVVALDTLLNTSDYPKVASVCLMAAKSSDELVKTCLHWATSTYRCGRYRLYAVARLLRIWSKHSIDLQKPVLDFLAVGTEMLNIDWADFYSLCADLVSSRHLSVGRYCQWLMARGSLVKFHEEGSCAFEAQLLLELPIHQLPEHVVNLRRSLLLSTGVDSKQEHNAIITVQAQLAEQLPVTFLGNTQINNSLTLQVHAYTLSRTQKSAIAHWIKQFVSSYAETQKQKNHNPMQEPHLDIGEPGFRFIRQIFEDLEEFVPFVDTLCALVVSARKGALLTAIAHTVNYHFDIFNSLGTANHLFHLLFSQRTLLSSQEALQSSLTLALLDLGVRLPLSGTEVRSLRKDDALLNSKHSAAAPSPISDTMLEAVHSDKTTFLEEMDQILANGTSMDHTTRTRCFRTITDHLEKSWGEETISCQYPELLARLRVFDEKTFDGLAAAWLRALITRSTRPALFLILVPLICNDVCTLGAVIDNALQARRSQSRELGALLALELLEMLSINERNDMLSLQCRTYRFLQQRQRILETHLESLISLLQSCIEAANQEDSPISSRAQRLLDNGSFKSFKRTIVSQVSITDKPIQQYSPNVQSALKDILSAEWSLGSTTSTTRDKVAYLLDSVSTLNKPLSQLSLAAILAMPSETEQNIPDTLTDVLLEKLTSVPQSRVIMWSHLLSTLPADIALPIQARVVKAILSEINSAHAVSSTDNGLKSERLLDIGMATSSNVPIAATLSWIEQILEHISKLGSFLQNDNEEGYSKPELGEISSRIDVLLRLLTTYQTAIQNPKFSQPLLAHMCLSLAHLYLCATNSSCTSLARHTFDVLAIMSDALSQDARSQSIETLLSRQQFQNPQVRFVFGNSNATGEEWLRLILGDVPKHEATKKHPHSPRHWEMMQDATPVPTENDTCLSLTLFAAKKSVF